MIYSLFQIFGSTDFPGHRLMDYISFRAGVALALGLLVALLLGNVIIRRLRRMQIGEDVRNLGLEGQMQKKGTPTMGGIIIILAIVIPCLLVGNLANIYLILMLVATLWMPVLQIYGSSMSPTVEEGEIVVSLKGPELRQGEIIAFYYNNKILVKRIIAGPGQWVDMDEDGSVRVDGELLAEPYLSEKALGQCDIDFPYQVPDERWFVMGDHRATSVDSRTTAIGCVAEEQIVGRIVFRVWPFRALGPVR
mgnify:CR=1 FL=1